MSGLALEVLILCHLFVGIALGLVLYLLFRNKWIVFTVAFGSVLPDLVDKPLGHLIMNESLDNGRLLFHGLMMVGIILVVALALRRTRYSVLFAGLALGMISHQLLDAMWLDPVAWFFPLMGPYVPAHYPDFFVHGLWAELTSPTEWIFLFVSASLIIPFTAWRWGWVTPEWKERLGWAARWVLRAGPWLLSIAGIIILVQTSLSTFQDVEDLTESVMLGVICLMGAIFLVYWDRKGMSRVDAG